MIMTLELTNFMSVVYAKHTFSPGLNVIRGANEAGKSTRFLAVAYALWGARALPDSLEDTVTWGHPASSLKVVLTFTLGDTIYTIVRTRAGASMAGSDNSLSEGQAEVTAQVERLTGASAQTGMMTLLTNQGDLQSSLGSVALIEKLSNTSLLDHLITAIGNNYPSGNTKQLEIELAKELVKPVPPNGDELTAVRIREAKLVEAQSKLTAAEAKLEECKPAVKKAVNLLSQRIEAERKMQDLQSRLKPKMQEPAKPVEPRSLEELQLLKEISEGLERAKKAHMLFRTLPKHGREGALDLFEAELAKELQVKQTLNEKLATLHKNRVEVAASGIWESSCALCGKLLTDVPEVVQINNKVELALAQLDLEIAEKTSEFVRCNVQITELDSLVHATKVVMASLPAVADYCSVDYSYTPPLIVWTAPLPAEVPSENFTALIAALHANRSNYVKTLAEVTAHNELCDSIEKELTAITLPDITNAIEVVETEKRLRLILDNAVAEKLAAEQSLREAMHALDKAQSVYNAQMVSYNTALASREQLLHLLNEYRENNALIAKLKAMKPVVSKALWSLVLLSVSTVFSQLRGVQSVVTRDHDGFLIDGRKARSYSGSTKDILGLAIRITLQKTFLPNLTFCLLDEPAAAADAVREEAMLAALSRVDFAQTILVTHSDLADTFAQAVHLL